MSLIISRSIRRIRRLYDNVLPYVALPKTLYVKAGTRLLKSELFYSRQVALVGNASSGANPAYAKLIDEHDIVIRMNTGYPLIVRHGVDDINIIEPWIDNVFVDNRTTEKDRCIVLKPDAPDEIIREYTNVKYIGQKTDIWSCSMADKNGQLFFMSRFNCMKVACNPHLFHLDLTLIRRQEFFRLPNCVYNSLLCQLKVTPSSGMIWIEFLRQLPVKVLSVFGFDFFESGYINKRSMLRFAANGLWPHDGRIEKQYFSIISGSDSRIHHYS